MTLFLTAVAQRLVEASHLAARNKLVATLSLRCRQPKEPGDAPSKPYLANRVEHVRGVFDWGAIGVHGERHDLVVDDDRDRLEGFQPCVNIGSRG